MLFDDNVQVLQHANEACTFLTSMVEFHQSTPDDRVVALRASSEAYARLVPLNEVAAFAPGQTLVPFGSLSTVNFAKQLDQFRAKTTIRKFYDYVGEWMHQRIKATPPERFMLAAEELKFNLPQCPGT